MDFKLDPLTWDLDMTTGEVEAVTGDAAVVQDIRVRYQLFLGEWFLDTRVGVPWFQEILGNKHITSDRVNYLLRRVLITTPKVVSILEFNLGKVSAQNRTIELSWKVLLDSGRVLKSSDFGPFILDLSTILG